MICFLKFCLSLFFLIMVVGIVFCLFGFIYKEFWSKYNSPFILDEKLFNPKDFIKLKNSFIYVSKDGEFFCKDCYSSIGWSKITKNQAKEYLRKNPEVYQQFWTVEK